MKIYIATSGTYSDYGIDAVFTNKSVADQFAATRAEQGCEIEEWDSDVWRPGVWLWQFTFDSEGNVIRKHKTEVVSENSENVLVWRGGIFVSVVGQSESGSIKIASERRARFIAHWDAAMRASGGRADVARYVAARLASIPVRGNDEDAWRAAQKITLMRTGDINEKSRKGS